MRLTDRVHGDYVGTRRARVLSDHLAKIIPDRFLMSMSVMATAYRQSTLTPMDTFLRLAGKTFLRVTEVN
jgi:arginine exporter protein ArgO